MKNFGFLYLIVLLYTYRTQKIESNGTCNCSLLGTVSSIEGDSICDEETLQCKCYPNVTGLNCDECSQDHYGIMSSEGCSSCSCDSFGSLSTQCDSVTGQCSCKQGHTGLTCDQCKALKYEYENSCIDCNCNVTGSEDLQCDKSGQCPCYENVEGKHCNQCKENTYNLNEGCIPCPACYDVVLTNIVTLRKNTTVAEKAIKGIETKLPSIIEDYEKFINEIQLLIDKIGTLRPNDTDLSLEKHEKLFLEIEQQIIDFQNSVQTSTNKLGNIKIKRVAKLVEKIKNSINDTGVLFESGQTELKSAATRSEAILSHNKTITELSKSSQTALEGIEKTVDRLLEDSTNISALVGETCNKAEKFEEIEKKVTAELADLQSKVTPTTDEVVRVKKNLVEFSQQVKGTHQEAQLIGGQANEVVIPMGEEMHEQYATIESTNAAISGVLDEVGDTAKELGEQIASMDAYLGSIDGQQKAIDGFLLAAEGYQMRAGAAIEMMGGAFSQGLSYMASYGEFQKMQQSIAELMKGASGVQALVDFIKEHATEVTIMFQELIEIIRGIENLRLKVEGLIKIQEGNNDLILSDLVLIQELEEEDKEIMEQLETYGVQLKSVRHNIDELNKIENELSSKVKELEAYMLLLDLILTDVDIVEQEIEKLESMYDTIDDLTKQKETLKEEVANIKLLLESLPIDDSTLCEAPVSEPKLTEGG